MASKRKSMIGGSAPAISDENMEKEDDDLNMSDDEEGGTRIGDIYIPPPVKAYCSTESIGPRLIITKISNTNFKSYAGDVVVGPFSNVMKTRMVPHNIYTNTIFSVLPCCHRSEWQWKKGER